MSAIKLGEKIGRTGQGRYTTDHFAYATLCYRCKWVVAVHTLGNDSLWWCELECPRIKKRAGSCEYICTDFVRADGRKQYK